VFHPEVRVNSGKKQRKTKEVHHHSRKISCEEEILESITGCKHPLIASGATTIGSARRTPNETSKK
jgi:hypothetical protein